MGKYFGTDGFRGEANVNLTVDHARKVGRFLGWYYGQLKKQRGDDIPAKVVIGKDTRRSSYMFEYALVAGLTASGADAYLLHVTTTPSVAYVARTEDFDCGIMISASHNPYYDNGIKLINGNGEKMDEATINLVEAYLDGELDVFGQKYEEIPFAHKDAIGCTVDYAAGRNRYMGYLISLGLYSFKGMKVGLDCANGSSWNMAKQIFDSLGAKTFVINAEPDGTNINRDAGSTHIEGLQKYVVENGLDVGFAYDGDADRCIAVDENGNIVDGDLILYVYGRYLKEKGALRLVYRVTGPKTGTESFSRLHAGAQLELLGPLGNGFPLEEAAGRRVFLMGGGIGVPPMLETMKQLDAKKIAVLGYRDELFLNEEFEKNGEVYIATEDGSAGTKGNVMDAIRGNDLEADVIFACGPKPMLRAIKAYALEKGIPCWVSMEERMACGIGACLGCVCQSTETDAHSHVHNKRVCKDGPVFRSTEVEL